MYKVSNEIMTKITSLLDAASKTLVVDDYLVEEMSAMSEFIKDNYTEIKL